MEETSVHLQEYSYFWLFWAAQGSNPTTCITWHSSFVKVYKNIVKCSSGHSFSLSDNAISYKHERSHLSSLGYLSTFNTWPRRLYISLSKLTTRWYVTHWKCKFTRILVLQHAQIHKYTLISHNSDAERTGGFNAHFRIRPYAAFMTTRTFDDHLYYDRDQCSYILSHVNANSEKAFLTLV